METLLIHCFMWDADTTHFYDDEIIWEDSYSIELFEKVEDIKYSFHYRITLRPGVLPNDEFTVTTLWDEVNKIYDFNPKLLTYELRSRIHWERVGRQEFEERLKNWSW